MKLSVALCTYNGSRFLPDQLHSIRDQTRLPDELIVCDDVSADNSVALAREFADLAPFPVKVFVNDNNLRSTTNFAHAISLCSGDVITLADQDDVWLPHKLAKLESALLENPQAGFVFSDAEMVDLQLQPLPYTLWEAIRFSRREQKRFQDGAAFEALLRRYRVTGATMAFRTCYRHMLLPIPPSWVHDAWIALLISAVAGCALVPEPLIRYRQHEQQQFGEKKRGLYAQYLVAKKMNRGTYAAVASKYAEAYARLASLPSVSKERLAPLERKVAHYRQRSAMREPGVWRLPLIAREAVRGHYGRYSLGWKSIAQDLWLA